MSATLLCVGEEGEWGPCPVEFTSLKYVVGGGVWAGNKKSGQLHEVDGGNDNVWEDGMIMWAEWDSGSNGLAMTLQEGTYDQGDLEGNTPNTDF